MREDQTWDYRDDAHLIAVALKIAQDHGQTDSAHNKAWVIDQMVRALTDCPMVTKWGTNAHGASYPYQARGESEAYRRFIATHNNGDEGPDTYSWDEGIAP